MKAALPPPGTPVIDKNGLMSPDWYVAFLAILNRTGGTSDDLIQRSLRVTNTGIVVATDPANGVGITRTIIGDGDVVVTNGSGVAGNPTISVVLPEGIGLSGSGLYLDGEFLGSAVWGFDVSFPSASLPDEIESQFQAAADSVFEFLVGATVTGNTVSGGSVVGTITFLAGNTTGTASWMSGAGYTVTAGTPLTLKGPSPNDATLSGVTAAIYGDES